MTSAIEALQFLRNGNRRFVTGDLRSERLASLARRSELTAGQEPFAVILGCSDSRVPVEIIFDQGLGDLFVIRVAGNVVAPSLIGSVEFAAAKFGTRLVVVLGHTNCGAINATLDELQQPASNPSRNLLSIVDRVRPSVEKVLAESAGLPRAELVRRAVRANIESSVKQLRHGSDLIVDLVRNDGLLVVGAEYSLETGLVEFLA